MHLSALTAGRMGIFGQDKRVIVRLGPLTNMTFHCLVKRICASLHEGIEWEGHSLPFWLVVEGYDSTALDTEIERMYILGQDR